MAYMKGQGKVFDDDVNNYIDNRFKDCVNDNDKTVKWEDRINDRLVDSWNTKDNL